MAAWRKGVKGHTVVPENDMCFSCFETTKYLCLTCTNPICNRCSVFEPNEGTPGWIAGKAVGYCFECKQGAKQGERKDMKTNHVKRAESKSSEATKQVKTMER